MAVTRSTAAERSQTPEPTAPGGSWPAPGRRASLAACGFSRGACRDRPDLPREGAVDFQLRAGAEPEYRGTARAASAGAGRIHQSGRPPVRSAAHLRLSGRSRRAPAERRGSGKDRGGRYRRHRLRAQAAGLPGSAPPARRPLNPDAWMPLLTGAQLARIKPLMIVRPARGFELQLFSGARCTSPDSTP